MTLEKASRWAVIVIAFVAVASALRAGSNVAAPLAFGLVLGVVMSPLSDFVDRIGVHRVFSALLSILLAVVLIIGLVVFAEPKVSYAIRRAPQIMAELSLLLEGLQDVVSNIDNMSEQVSEALSEDESEGAEAPAGTIAQEEENQDDGEDGEEEEEGLRLPSGSEALSLAPSFAAQVLITIGAFFFFLLSRHEIYEWAARRRDDTSDGPTARTLKEAERLVARYFLTITVINTTLGLTVGIVFHALGMPGPYVWGFVAAALNYILYIGPAVFAVSALLGGLLAFDGAAGMLPAILYVCINGVEGNFVTPTLVGRNMQVNPLLVFLSLVFWLWLWGPLGAVVAIPILLYALAVVSGFGVTEPIKFGRARAAAGETEVSGPRPGG